MILRIYITTLIDITSIYQVFRLTKYIQEDMSYDSLPQRIKTGSTYNGIIRPISDLNVLVHSFITLIQEKHQLNEKDMIIQIN